MRGGAMLQCSINYARALETAYMIVVEPAATGGEP
jgi:hypothetical protein